METKTESRRSFLSKLLYFGGGVLATTSSSIGIKCFIDQLTEESLILDIGKEFLNLRQNAISIVPARENISLKSLLKPASSYVVRNESDLLQYFSYASLEGAKAFRQFVDLDNYKKFKSFEQVEHMVRPNFSDTIVAIGSPTSNGLIRSHMFYQASENPGEGLFRIEAFDDLINFPIKFQLDPVQIINHIDEENRYYRSMDIRGNPTQHKIPNWGLVFPDGNTHLPLVDTYSGCLKEEYVVISKIPNLTSPEYVERLLPIIAVGGTHGVGTMAIGKIFQDVKAMCDFKTKLQAIDYPFWQIVFTLEFEPGTDQINNIYSSKIYKVEVRAPGLIELASEYGKWKMAAN